MQTGPAASESPPVSERRRLMRDAVANNLSAPVSALAGILLVPFMLKALGRDDYGLWIVATSMSGIIPAIGLGLYWSVSRVVAADPAGGEGDNADFVGSAGNVYLLTGVAGCLVIGAAGMLSGGYLHLPPVGRRTVVPVFWLVGGVLCAEQISAFGFSVLAGLRRFKLLNLIGGIANVAWAVGAVAVLVNGGSVTAVAGCQLAVSMLKCMGTMRIIARLSPKYGFRPLFFRWHAFRRHISFTASSLLMDGFSGIAWNSAPALIGFIGGSAAAVPFYVGQKFPLAVSAMGNRAAEVLYPAASENRHDLEKSGEVLRAGLRWVMALVLPFAVLLFVAAPGILHAWVGDAPPGSVIILRVMTATVLAEAVLLAPVLLLWGRGVVRPVLFAYVGQGVGVVALTTALVYRFGAAGAAWGMLVPIAASAAALFVVAARECAIDAWKLAARTWRGLLLPALACGISASSVLYFPGGGRLRVVAAMAAGGVAYMGVLFGFSGMSEEKQFARHIYRLVRSTAAKVHSLRSAWHFAGALIELARDQWRKPSFFEGFFATVDPWECESDEARDHFLRVDSMLERVKQVKFRRALEVGCAEGVFTEMLARRCESLDAVDFAPTALDRARQRLPHSNIRFELFDVRQDPLPGTFDLVVAMDVLDCIHRPSAMRRVRDKLVAALEPGGCLLVVVQRHELLETMWWSRMLLRGGKNIRDYIGSHPSLRLVYEDTTEYRVFAVFRNGPA
jgi:O-antigen/teichoic acid export membrane protein/protein-L-isoaspartate O-methyltransferase